MNLPDAPIAHAGFFAAHFTVSDQENRKTFMSEFLAGKCSSQIIPATSSRLIRGSFSIPAAAPHFAQEIALFEFVLRKLGLLSVNI